MICQIAAVAVLLAGAGQNEHQATVHPDAEPLKRSDLRRARDYAIQDLSLGTVQPDHLEEVLAWDYRESTVAHWLLLCQQTDVAVASARRGTFFRDGSRVARVLFRLGACSLLPTVPGVPRLTKLLVSAACWVGAVVVGFDEGALDYQMRVYSCLRDRRVSADEILGWSDDRRARVILQPFLVQVGPAGWIEVAECEPARRLSSPFFLKADPRQFYEQAESVWWVSGHSQEYHVEKMQLREAIVRAARTLGSE